MVDIPHELLAIRKLGLVAIFFSGKWNGWNFFRKSAALLWHWQTLVRTARAAKGGSLWQVPKAFKEKAKLGRLKPPGEMKRRSRKPTAKKVKPPSKPRPDRIGNRQGSLPLD